uniref:LRRCT domain-containing protein n=2 Tax=Tetranychus urticae TaxID=32264 RepID=T1JZG3_TETUR
MRCTCLEEKLSVNCKESSLDVVPITLNPGIRELFLSNNLIKSISSSFSFYTHLSILDLSSNQISSLHKKNFQHQRNLQLLILSGNRLTHLTNESFTGLDSLRSLNLAENSLTTLTSRTFTGLTKLEKLDLSRNTINEISDEAFYGLNSLKWLSLRSNQLTSVPSIALYLVPSLSLLDLGHNSLTSLVDNGFASLARLTDLRLDLCSISSIATSFAHGMVNLKRLHLDGNELETIESHFFNDITSLEELFIGANKFTTIKDYTFHSLGNSLISLDIRNARELINFHPNALHGLTKLTRLTIEYCPKLTSLPSQLFKDSQGSMRELRIRSNGLTSLPNSLLTHWTQLTVFDVRDNHWNCNCSILWLWKYLRKVNGNSFTNRNTNNNNNLSSLPTESITFSDLICFSPQPLSGKRLTSLSPDDDIDCSNPNSTSTLIVVSLIVGLIMIITIALMVLWCRTRLPLILLRHKKFTNNLTEEFVYEKGRFIENQVMFPPSSSPYHPHPLHHQPHLEQHRHQSDQFNTSHRHPNYHSTSPYHPSSSLIIIQSPVKMGPISQV